MSVSGVASVRKFARKTVAAFGVVACAHDAHERMESVAADSVPVTVAVGRGPAPRNVAGGPSTVAASPWGDPIDCRLAAEEVLGLVTETTWTARGGTRRLPLPSRRLCEVDERHVSDLGWEGERSFCAAAILERSGRPVLAHLRSVDQACCSGGSAAGPLLKWGPRP